jgi:Ca-activated chloride channel family protein
MRTIFMLALLAIALPAEASSNWERLWFNADQRGEKLLQHGDAGAAARVYKDPRRRAYAEMKAGQFKQAASELGTLHDSDSDYNRGNALAKMGDLKGALDAYDAALKSDPKNHDAQHNRDLVEKALQQQSSKQKSGDNQQQDGKSGGKQGNKPNSGSGEQGKQAGRSDNNANSANNKSGQQSSEKNSSPSGKSGSNPAGENSAAQQNQQKNPGQNKGNADAQSGQGQTGAATASQQQAEKLNNQSVNGQSADEMAQAKKDAEAGLAANKPGANGNRIANAAPADQTAPLSEQQLSKEQWLRSIPDDPGGLLRRKFMIEYMLRQQKAQQ